MDESLNNIKQCNYEDDDMFADEIGHTVPRRNLNEGSSNRQNCNKGKTMDVQNNSSSKANSKFKDD